MSPSDPGSSTVNPYNFTHISQSLTFGMHRDQWIMQRWRRIIHPNLSLRGASHPHYACIIESRSPFVVFSMRFRCRTCACCTTRPRTGLEHQRAGRPRALTYQPRVCTLCSPRLKCPRSVRVHAFFPSALRSCKLGIPRSCFPCALVGTARTRTGLDIGIRGVWHARAAVSDARPRPVEP
ncbi:hypothetical protein HYPSUDRAFT_441207 [Hypholoma sublateritium FD-334 SS-4]|uniref:Uncharacterized protein n=1 Tax=Hypholoma sublateritium (strain FD-334 SS-4) TaxID=945553 RepID=A0A0D2LD04_HYPSF|nr:hypothetical protein HYPSUDRAFT_441207 [Hypholoma sublateritium FD-334 SS-4]